MSREALDELIDFVETMIFCYSDLPANALQTKLDDTA
jgi:hypothetical protein